MVENFTIQSFIDFANEFNQLGGKEINKIQLIKLNAFLDVLISNKSHIKKILEQANSDQLLFSLADRCTKVKLQSEEIAAAYKKTLHKILNIIRTPALLQFINKNKKENEWVKLILRLIKLSSYTTGDLFLQRVEEYDERPLFKVINSHKITNYNWTDIYIKVFQIAGALENFYIN